MALNFPPQSIGGSLPPIGQEWYDASSDTTWEVIDHVSDGSDTIAVWQIKLAGSGSNFGGIIDITIPAPSPLPPAGTYYVVKSPGGTGHSDFGNLAGETFVGGEQVIYTGEPTDPWIQIGGTLPEATTSQRGIIQLATVADILAQNDDKAVTPNLLSQVGSGNTGDIGYWNRTGTTLSPVNDGDGAKIFGGLEALTTGDYTSKSAFKLYSNGLIHCYRPTTSGALMQWHSGVPGGNQDNVITFSGDGSADFQAHVRIGGTLPSAPNISLNADGSGTFKKGLTVSYPGVGANVIQEWKSNYPSADFTKARLYANATFSLGGGTDNDGSPIFRVGGLDGNTSIGGDIIGGDPNIALDGSNGTAKFKSDVKIIGTGTAADPNISLNAEGTATFEGTVSVANFDSPTASTAGINLYDSGSIYFRRVDDSPIFRGYDGSTVKSEIGSDGSATFAGGDYTIAAGGQCTNSQGFQAGGDPASGNRGSSLGETGFIQATNASNKAVFTGRQEGSTSETCEIFGNGSATFAGNILSESQINVIRNDSLAAFQVLQGANTVNADVKASISADGSATFAGNVNIGDQAQIELLLDNKHGRINLSDLSGTRNIQLFGSNGSATFAGTVGVSQLVSKTTDDSTWFNTSNSIFGTQYAWTTKNQAVDKWTAGLTQDGILRMGSLSVGDYKIQLFGEDGTANFAGNINAGNVTFDVGTADEINVRDRLEKARETFQELQVAVANATDFSGLKAAMMVALEDYANGGN